MKVNQVLEVHLQIVDTPK